MTTLERYRFRFRENERLEVPVTASHIRDGERCSRVRCMIAMALRERFAAWSLAFSGHREGVGLPYAVFTVTAKSGVRERYRCVLDGQQIVAEMAFDRGEVPKPFTCTMTVVRRTIVAARGSRASRALPPKARHARRVKPSGGVVCVRRYHQLRDAVEFEVR